MVEHSGALTFPFKRWQIQKVWRGERPQEGRFREFVQADIDVIGAGDLPDHYEVELPLVMVSALEELRAYGLPKATVHANNRKLSEGFYRGLGLTDIEGVLREIDKLDKIGADEVARLLSETCGATEAQARACLELAELTASDGAELAAKFDALCEAHGIAEDSEAYELARQGLDTLAMIVDEAAAIRPGSVIADLKIARGLDYYTGSVYETFLDGAASLGSICSGGRYDNLASQGNRKYPGVGLSIGLSRLVSYMLHGYCGCPANRRNLTYSRENSRRTKTMSQTAYRTHHATEVTEALVGQKVTLAGWVDRRRDHGGVAFIDLRDATGLVQVVIYDEDMARPLRSEFVIQVTGDVRLRPDGNENTHLATGKIEVVAESIEVLAKADALPFQVSTALENESENKLPGEDVRLKYRYLDLRRPSMQHNLKLRSDMAKAARHALEDMDFTEVETPTFIKSTPEGARDFVVPARLVPGSWYALPQSPQLLKQLLMVSGVERYYQLARCYRDEDFRADRQPEFTQLDMEMAYVDQEDVMAMTEKVIAAIWKSAGYEVQLPLPRITWKDAMDKYGSDKPDLRFGNPLVELTDYFKNTPFRVFQAPYVGAVVFKGGAATPRRQFDAWQDWARQRGAKGLAYVVFGENGELKGPVAKNLSDEERNGLREAVGAEEGDAVFFAAGSRESSQLLLGAVRVELASREGLLDPKKFAFTWVVDFPLFKPTDDPDDDDVAVGHSKWTSMHHPFTMPSKDWIDKFDKDPEHAMSDSYDIVCNGEEMGGGSVRIHRDDIQARVLDVLGITKEEADEKFGFLLEAFKYGAPPHAGLALGWDRTVSILAGADSIRDVIAFPISDEQRAETGVDYDPDADEN